MRTRAWRRYKEETIVIRRIKRMVSYELSWWGFHDVNDIKHKYPTLTDYIGTKTHFQFKSHTTDRYDTRHKVKYSTNKGKCYWRDNNKKGTRERAKKEFLKMLKEYGIK
jgi:beta-mannanase